MSLEKKKAAPMDDKVYKKGKIIELYRIRGCVKEKRYRDDSLISMLEIFRSNNNNNNR